MDIDYFSVVTAGRSPSFQRLICGGSPGSRPGGEGEQRRGQESPADKSLKRPDREARNERKVINALQNMVPLSNN